MRSSRRVHVAATVAVCSAMFLVGGCSLSLGLDDMIAALWPCSCDPNASVVAGLVEDPNQWDPNNCDPNYCDPNLCCPDDEPNETDSPTGYCEVTGPVGTETVVSDPNSTILEFFAEIGQPLEEMPPAPIIPSDRRPFLLFDAQGRGMLVLAYIPSENVIELSCDPDEELVLGMLPTFRPDEGVWVYQRSNTIIPPGEVIEAAFVFTVVLRPGDLVQGRVFTMELSRTVTFLVDWPANADTGRPAIPAGSSVTLAQTDTYTMTSSESPYELFRDADFRVKEPEEGEE
jgi:hypothetical protein